MKELTRNIAIGFLILLSCNSLMAQSRTQLEEERSRIIKQIEQTSKNLEKTESNKKATLDDLKVIENQIKNRKQLIKNIQDQLKSADQAIASNSGKIVALDQDMDRLDEQYNQLARNMYLRELAGNKWAYVFSASSVNDAFLRWRYSKQFEAFAKQKTEQVSTLKVDINDKTNTILEEKEYVKKLLVDEKKNYSKLEQDQKKKDKILSKLKKEESSLKKDLNKKKKEREKLNNEIEKIILAELSKNKSKATEKVTADIKNKKLAWPAKGYITGKFGNQAHPTIKNVRINNNGIDIKCAKSAPVSAVAEGKVISITSIPGYDNMIILQHGSYYSVYSKLSHIIVKKDEILQPGQTIGRLKNIDAPELHFEFWKGKTKLDPAKWLKK